MYTVLTTIRLWVKTHVRSERGQDLIEYALLGGILATAILAALFLLGPALDSMATGIGDCIDFDSASTCAPF